MKRTSLHSLEPSSARKKIAAAKSNKPFMAALLDRDHRGHRDAVEQWTRLHEAGFPEAGRSNGPGAEEPVRALGFAFIPRELNIDRFHGAYWPFRAGAARGAMQRIGQASQRTGKGQ